MTTAQKVEDVVAAIFVFIVLPPLLLLLGSAFGA